MDSSVQFVGGNRMYEFVAQCNFCGQIGVGVEEAGQEETRRCRPSSFVGQLSLHAFLTAAVMVTLSPLLC